MFKNCKFYRHLRFMDVMIYVTRVQMLPDGYLLDFEWWNRSQTGKPFIIDYDQYQILIEKELAKNWEEVYVS